jgi:hypothetical protein
VSGARLLRAESEKPLHHQRFLPSCTHAEIDKLLTALSSRKRALEQVMPFAACYLYRAHTILHRNLEYSPLLLLSFCFTLPPFAHDGMQDSNAADLDVCLDFLTKAYKQREEVQARLSKEMATLLMDMQMIKVRASVAV